MRTENVSLPYPVLGISDDITPSLEETGCSSPIITIVEEEKEFPYIGYSEIRKCRYSEVYPR